MLNRFALVIHWISFLSALVIFTYPTFVSSEWITEYPPPLEISSQGLAILENPDSADLSLLSEQDLNNFMANNQGREKLQLNRGVFLASLLSAILISSLGWIIRFILTGSKVLFPWDKSE